MFKIFVLIFILSTQSVLGDEDYEINKPGIVMMDLKNANITGKKLTPSLLSYLVKKTKGKTLLSNIELVKSNAVLGARVAKALSSF